MLQEALLRDAVKFEREPQLGSDIAVAIVDALGNEVINLREDWLPTNIYGADDYARRITELSRRRFYGMNEEDKAGILRYTKVVNELYDLSDIPIPENERELTWLLSFFWNVDQAYNNIADLDAHKEEGIAPSEDIRQKLQAMYRSASSNGIILPREAISSLESLGLTAS